jgi:hypothetical protein
MMFGRGGSRRDRAILRQKVTALAAKGIGGWWRIAKNLTRYGLRVGQEHPATPEFWEQALRDAGLVEVCFEPVAAEAGIVRGARPPSGISGMEPEQRPSLRRQTTSTPWVRARSGSFAWTRQAQEASIQS